MKPIRLAAGMAILGLFAAGFFTSASLVGPIHLLLVRLQLAPAAVRLLSTGGAAALGSGAVILLVFIVTLLFGRLYCGLLCPLGLLQDLIGLLHRHPYRRQKAFSMLHAGILLLTLGAALAGFMTLVTLIEPYALFGRLMRDLIGPLAAGIINLSGRALMPFSIYLPAYPLSVHPGAAGVSGIVALLLIAAVLSRGRLFCNTLCPVGAALRPPASLSRFGIRLKREECILCGRCAAACPTGCIDLETRTVSTDRCVMCLNCLGLCPVNAISYELPRHVESGKKSRPGLSRRGFLKLLGLGGTGILIGCSPGEVSSRALAEGGLPESASPPGSEGTIRFSSRCIACHLCVSRCPTRVLQPGLFAFGPRGVNQPFMDFSAGFCEYECVECSLACPTGAILPLEAEKKKRVQIGEALFIEERCIVITEGTACGACAEVCPTGAVRMVPYQGLLTLPITTPEVCIGCGHCENTCPSLPQKAILVSGKETHGTALEAIPDDAPAAAAEELKVEQTGGEDDFPF